MISGTAFAFLPDMNGIIMKSINFEFLRDKWPELASLGGFAERYAWPDPESAFVKLRSFIETMIHRFYEINSITLPEPVSLHGLLSNNDFKNAVPKAVLNALHNIRLAGNKAAHGETSSRFNLMDTLKDAFYLGCWFYIINGGKQNDCPDYIQPEKPVDIYKKSEELKEQKRKIQEELASKEIEMQELLDHLEAAWSQASTTQKKVEELEAILNKGTAVADALGFDEATTRKRLIDNELAIAGWNVGTNGENTQEVTQEEEVSNQPTSSEIGYADYVLWDDNGLPLAVIEAKKTSKNAQIGQEQARLYANGLEKQYGQRPIIFYTNGFDIFIWDDAQNYPPRQLYGYYSKDSLQYLIFQRKNRLPLNQFSPKREIVDRIYQIEAIKRVTEKYTNKHRKALLVQATGTGKTRVAIALTELLYRAHWIMRVLFLCDRKELRKQAKNVFNEFLNEPMTVVTADTANDRNKRIYLATYPAMKRIYDKFDTGFFDLIIADESHRSIYNRYQDMFRYFDCYQIGLTATPVDFISRNTFKMFDCEDGTPTAYYSLDNAIEENYLVPFEVFEHTTRFLRVGIKYKDLTKEQIKQLEENGEDPELFNFENQQIDKQIFNRDTNRMIIRNLMENGIRDETGQHPGKSIIFARNHNHAVLLAEVFNELYPQYGGKFCRIIDNYDPRAEQLIDDFKAAKESYPMIAISVDMLDTGIDVPEVVNLVFAKPVKSMVKFEQMIGRGTRLCPDLFGPGINKANFRIFDHWRNFNFFDRHYKKTEPSVTKSIMEQLFEARIGLCRTALNNGETEGFNLIVPLIRQDIEMLSEDTISVREKWREKRTMSKMEILKQFSPATEQTLRREISPLMKWVDIHGHTEAYRFDLLIAEIQTELLQKSGRFSDLKDKMLDWVSRLQMHLNPVREKVTTINMVKGNSFWDTPSVISFEKVREELRGIMKYTEKQTWEPAPHKHIDISDTDEEYRRIPSTFRFSDMPGFRQKVMEALRLFDENETLKKIKAGKSVTKSDLSELTSLVLTGNPGVEQDVLKEFFETAGPLDYAIRGIIGMDADAVNERFLDFISAYPSLKSSQISFLNLLKNHISRYGSIEIEQLYEPPFTTLHSDGLDGVFDDENMVEKLLNIISTFQPKAYIPGERPYGIN